MAVVLFVELPSADNEAAAAIPRRLFYAPNHSIEAQCLHTRHSGTERSEEAGIHTSDDFGVSACRKTVQWLWIPGSRLWRAPE